MEYKSWLKLLGNQFQICINEGEIYFFEAGFLQSTIEFTVFPRLLIKLKFKVIEDHQNEQ